MVAWFELKHWRFASSHAITCTDNKTGSIPRTRSAFENILRLSLGAPGRLLLGLRTVRCSLRLTQRARLTEEIRHDNLQGRLLRRQPCRCVHQSSARQGIDSTRAV